MSLKLLCDENLPNVLDVLLTKEGHSVMRPRPGSSDTAVAELAKKEKRILISFDGDFGNILNYPPSEFFGIIRLNVHPPTISLVAQSLMLVFENFKQQRAFRGKLIIAEPAGFRVWEKGK